MIIAIISAVSFLIGSWYLMIAILGLFPRFRAKSIGVLTKPNVHRNSKDKHGHTIPILTRYGYVYTVNGKQYCYSAEGRFSERRLMPRAPIIYIKGFPRHAYPNKFRGTKEWVLGMIFFVSGIVYLYLFLSYMP